MEIFTLLWYNDYTKYLREELMEDRLCLIPYSEIEFDKTYTNISEYFLRGNRAVNLFLATNGADEKIAFGQCSDYELLSAFMKISAEKGTDKSAIENTFYRVVNELIGEKIADIDDVWTKTSEALIDKKLRERISFSKAKKIGVPVLPNEYFDEHFVSVKGVDIKPVFCPFGTQNVSHDTFCSDCSLEDIKETIEDQMACSTSIAVFFSGFKFEKPNEYSASKAYEKYRAGQALLNKEQALLTSQLLRTTALSAAEIGKELMIFLPYAPDVMSMGAAAEFIDYIDDSLSNKKLKASVFGGDAVSLCMAESIAGKKYKNITAVTGICGNGSDMPDLSSATYWGFGEKTLQNYASLATTPALLPNR